MNAARSLPVLAVLAANDNAIDEDELSSHAFSDRARAALASPLRTPDDVPAPSCRRFHALTSGGERVLSSILAVEWFGGVPQWRASVTIWGRPNAERREVARLLAEQLLAGLGAGARALDQRPCATIARKPLSARERAALLSSTSVTRARTSAAARTPPR